MYPFLYLGTLGLCRHGDLLIWTWVFFSFFFRFFHSLHYSSIYFVEGYFFFNLFLQDKNHSKSFWLTTVIYRRNTLYLLDTLVPFLVWLYLASVFSLFNYLNTNIKLGFFTDFFCRKYRSTETYTYPSNYLMEFTLNFIWANKCKRVWIISS